MRYENVDMSELLGKTLDEVKSDGIEITFHCGDDTYQMFHHQECCEDVELESINGNLDDLVGSPITLSEEVSSDEERYPLHGHGSSWTWTFYKLATVKGYVDIRWFGSSNGYYSEDASLYKVLPDKTWEEMGTTEQWMHAMRPMDTPFLTKFMPNLTMTDQTVFTWGQSKIVKEDDE